MNSFKAIFELCETSLPYKLPHNIHVYKFIKIEVEYLNFSRYPAGNESD